jgi:hypothetical protein
MAARPWAPYAVAGTLLLADYLLLARGLHNVRPGFDYRVWALNHGVYSDVLQLSLDHYLRVGHVVHPLPYLHDRIEYPVLLGFTLWLPAWLPGGPAGWLAAAGVLTAAATFGSIALLRRHSPGSAWWLAASPALLLDAAINWDLIGIAFLVAGVVWFAGRRWRLSGAATAVGACFKLFPVVVAPMALSALGARWWHAHRSGPDRSGPEAGGDPEDRSALGRWLVPFAVVGVVVWVPFLWLARSDTLWFFRFNNLRPQKDSLWGMLAQVFGRRWSSIHLINTVSLLVVVAAVAYGAWMVWRIPADDQARGVALASAVAVIVWMTVNKVWNPQYILWVFAAGGIASMPARFGVALGAVSVYDYWFEFVLRIPDQPNSYSWVGDGSVVARTAVFALMAGWAVGRMRELAVPSDRGRVLAVTG